jgi:hypothetical protein
MMYIVVVFAVASLCGCWEWSYSNFRGDPDGQWVSFHRWTPIWRPPTADQIHHQLDKSSGEGSMAAVGEELIIRHDWTKWLAAVLIVIFPAFAFLKRFARRSVRADWKLRFIVTSMTGVYAGMIVWLVVWVCTGWRPPSIFPYCGVGLIIGAVVAAARRQSDQLANKAAEATADPPCG